MIDEMVHRPDPIQRRCLEKLFLLFVPKSLLVRIIGIERTEPHGFLVLNLADIASLAGPVPSRLCTTPVSFQCNSTVFPFALDGSQRLPILWRQRRMRVLLWGISECSDSSLEAAYRRVLSVEVCQ
jgi:hypothetical protein